jgi:plasmid stability protein
MASITIRNIEPRLKAQLRVRAARHDRSMEEEVRVILRDAIAEREDQPVNLASTIAARFKSFGGVDLELPAREPMRSPPKLR